MRITGRTQVLGVIGDPIRHSLSPVMHNCAFAALGLDCAYVPFLVREGGLPEAVAAVRALHLLGINVTVPHKVAILAHLDALDRTAELIGAVNTVVNDDGRLAGHNTDGPGFLRSLREDAGVDPAGARLVILGAGGSARAIAVQMALAGAGRVVIANRTRRRAEELAALVAAVRPGISAAACALDEPELRQELAAADVLIHTTTWGMSPREAVAPLVDVDTLAPTALVCDIVYSPLETALLRAARERGCRTLGGLGMLAYQGATAFELWTGRAAPVDIMRAALYDAFKEADPWQPLAKPTPGSAQS